MTSLAPWNGSRWKGSSELWLDPLGDKGVSCAAGLEVGETSLSYTWSYEGKAQQGSVSLGESSATFRDSWHQPEEMQCRLLSGARGIFQVEGSYGPEQDWGWRIGLFLRQPTGELVLQMTNIAPWGEEARAVRMTLERTGN